MRDPRPLRPFAALLPILLLSVACGGGGGGDDVGDGAPAGPRVESPELGIAIAAVPAGFELVGVQDGVLELSYGTEATLTMVTEAPEVGGVNLVEAVREHKAEIQTRPGGTYKGQQELMTANLGTAYYSRGVWEDAGARREEAAVFLLHPMGDRMLRVVYRYPAGDDSQARVQEQLFAVVGELEDFGTPAESIGGVGPGEEDADAPAGAGDAAPDNADPGEVG